MTTDIILSKVPFPCGDSTSIVMRVLSPTSVTWETIFKYIEKKTNMPRYLFAGTNNTGQYVYGKRSPYPPWNYDKYRLYSKSGRILSSAFVSIHFTP
jgi:hypothetical protein